MKRIDTPGALMVLGMVLLILASVKAARELDRALTDAVAETKEGT